MRTLLFVASQVTSIRALSTTRSSWRQSVNFDALNQLAFALRRPQCLIPHLSLGHINEIDFLLLKKSGIQAICFDKDNTLTLPYQFEPAPLVSVAINNAIANFGYENCVILSNSAGSTLDDPYSIDAKRTETAIGLSVVRHKRKKPDCLDELLSSLKLSDPSSICVIGDRLFTDILFAHRHGMFALHINRPLSLHGDNLFSIIIRFFENRIYLPFWRTFIRISPPPHPIFSSLLFAMKNTDKVSDVTS
mmetsp:Transcript_69/g.122  ORF Transcript_69/g.122 Transcript_69/m.122 type:complete len:248 (+) Transcript_69:30-773(+)